MEESDQLFAYTESPAIQVNDPVEKYTKMALNGKHDKVPAKYVAKVQKQLQERKKKAIEDEQFMLAQKLEDTYKLLDDRHQLRSYSKMKQSKFRDLEEKVEKAQEELDEVVQKVNSLAEQYNKEREESIVAFDNEKAQELQKYTDDLLQNIPASYQKFSWEYLQLRKQEEFLVSSKRYVEAHELKISADKMEAQERKNQQEIWKKHVMTLQQSLIQKQQQQRDCLLQSWEEKWMFLEPNAKQEVDKAQQKLKVAEANLSVAKTGSSTLPPLKGQNSISKGREFRVRQLNYARQNFPRPGKQVRSTV